MNKDRINQLNPTAAINEALPKIVEAFVAFYGEEERDRITTKFQNMLVIGYSTPSNLQSLLLDINNEKAKEFSYEFLDKVVPISEDKEEWKKILLDNNEVNYPTLNPISRYIKYLSQNEISEYSKKELVEFLKKFCSDVTLENLDDFIKQGKFKMLDDIIPSYEEACAKYERFEQELQPYTSYVDKCKEIEKKVNKKYSEKFIDELKDLFTEEEYTEMKQAFQERIIYSIQDFNKKTKNFFGYSLNSPAIIDAFTEESDKLLIEGSSWKIDSIKKDRVKYFKNFGLDLGDTYEDYINNPQVQELIPNKEMVSRIISARKDIYTKYWNEYCSSIPNFQRDLTRINDANLLDKCTGYDANLYKRAGNCVLTNIKQQNGVCSEYPIVCINVRAYGEYMDATIIHELNHVLELFLISVEANRYEMISGWEKFSCELSAQNEEIVSLEERAKRKYELFCEIINEMLAQEISQIMSDMGIYIFNTEKNKKIKGGTGYERSVFLVKKFYDTYKKEIIESRKNGNISVIFDAIGKENFDALNDLFHEYYENFNEFSMITTYQDLDAGKETEQTKKFKEIILKRDEILNNMNEYHQSKSVAVY